MLHTAMHRLVQLPTSPEPGWELQEASIDEAQLNSVAESLIVLQSLKQSRNKWITSAFPKFSSKARGNKAAEHVPPPHTIKAHGKYDLHVGPHVFSNTAFYEAHYLPSVNHGTGPDAQYHDHDAQASTSASYVTPALSAKVQLAAETNPTLSNLLNAVIKHTATDEEVKRLGVLIHQLEGIPKVESSNLPSPTPPITARAGSPKPFDLILEFHEKPSDRWILPRGHAFCERVGVPDGIWARYSDVIITMCICASSSPSELSEQPSSDSIPPEVVSFRFLNLPHSLWELLVTWAGGPQKMEESKIGLINMVKLAAPRSYLQQRLPVGELLTELQNATAPSYAMKPLKPAGADSTRAKRKTLSRKSTLIVPDTPLTRPDKPIKRRQSLKAKPSVPPTPIACHACGQTDVPLMMGGRYCRSCIDAGNAVADIPQVQALSRGGGMSPAHVPAAQLTGSSTQARIVTSQPSFNPVAVYPPFSNLSK